jgi:hypothetical protein
MLLISVPEVLGSNFDVVKADAALVKWNRTPEHEHFSMLILAVHLTMHKVCS